MHKIIISFVLLLTGVLCFPQQSLKIIGRIPEPHSDKISRIQVGAFKTPHNAETASRKLKNAGLHPVHENYRDFTRVLLTGIRAWNMPVVLKTIELLGFNEAWITEDRNAAPQREFLIDPDAFYGEMSGPPPGRTETPNYPPRAGSV
ncbi:MAG: SPOR domain-containing protein [Treponema sp.]|jgi:hypothetical protein|nr:SPOR domain-containing protein [Treponema sp.]